MEVIPSIDLLDGKVVRLLKGDYEQVTVYDSDPATLATTWRAHAHRLHVVDLEGARSGVTTQQNVVRGLVRAFGSGVQIGGGVRHLDTVRAYFDLGVDRVVLGTAAIRDPEFAARACEEFPDRIVIAVDARDGWVATDGWKETSSTRAIDLVRRFATLGVAAVLYTDIERDGTEVGPNVEATAALAREGGAPVIASGGVGKLEHLRALGAADARIVGAIIGRSLHEGRFSLLEAQRAASGNG